MDQRRILLAHVGHQPDLGQVADLEQRRGRARGGTDDVLPNPTWRCITIPPIGAVTAATGSSFIRSGAFSIAVISASLRAQDAQSVAHRRQRDLRAAGRRPARSPDRPATAASPSARRHARDTTRAAAFRWSRPEPAGRAWCAASRRRQPDRSAPARIRWPVPRTVARPGAPYRRHGEQLDHAAGIGREHRCYQIVVDGDLAVGVLCRPERFFFHRLDAEAGPLLRRRPEHVVRSRAAPVPFRMRAAAGPRAKSVAPPTGRPAATPQRRAAQTAPRAPGVGRPRAAARARRPRPPARVRCGRAAQAHPRIKLLNQCLQSLAGEACRRNRGAIGLRDAEPWRKACIAICLHLPDRRVANAPGFRDNGKVVPASCGYCASRTMRAAEPDPEMATAAGADAARVSGAGSWRFKTRRAGVSRTPKPVRAGGCRRGC